MYLLEAMSHSQFQPSAEHCVGIIRTENKVDKAAAKDHMHRVFQSAFSMNPLPNKIIAHLRIDKSHWCLICLDIQKGLAFPKLTVVDSTSPSLYCFPEIDEIAQEINDILIKSNELKEPITTENRDLIVRTQYGKQACSIASDLNTKHLRDGTIGTQHALQTEELDYSGPRVKIKTEICKSKVTCNSYLDEMITRVLLHLEIMKRDSLREELLSHPKIFSAQHLT